MSVNSEGVDDLLIQIFINLLLGKQLCRSSLFLDFRRPLSDEGNNWIWCTQQTT